MADRLTTSTSKASLRPLSKIDEASEDDSGTTPAKSQHRPPPLTLSDRPASVGDITIMLDTTPSRSAHSGDCSTSTATTTSPRPWQTRSPPPRSATTPTQSLAFRSPTTTRSETFSPTIPTTSGSDDLDYRPGSPLRTPRHRGRISLPPGFDLAAAVATAYTNIPGSPAQSIDLGTEVTSSGQLTPSSDALERVLRRKQRRSVLRSRGSGQGSTGADAVLVDEDTDFENLGSNASAGEDEETLTGSEGENVVTDIEEDEEILTGSEGENVVTDIENESGLEDGGSTGAAGRGDSATLASSSGENKEQRTNSGRSGQDSRSRR